MKPFTYLLSVITVWYLLSAFWPQMGIAVIFEATAKGVWQEDPLYLVLSAAGHFHNGLSFPLFVQIWLALLKIFTPASVIDCILELSLVAGWLILLVNSNRYTLHSAAMDNNICLTD